MNNRQIIGTYIVALLIVVLSLANNLSQKRTPTSLSQSSSMQSSGSDTLTSDTLAYGFDTLLIGDREDTTSLVSLSLITVALSDSSSVSQKINRQLAQTSFLVLYSDSLQPMETFTSSVEAQYAQDLSTVLEVRQEFELQQTWEFTLSTTVLLNSPALLSFQVDNYSYTGGAHGNYATQYVVYSVASGEELSFFDMVIEDSLPGLTKMAEQAFRAEKEIAPDSTLNSAGYWFEDEQFRLSTTMGLTDSSLLFYYAPYDIAPYSMGPTTIELPFESCKEYLSIGL